MPDPLSREDVGPRMDGWMDGLTGDDRLSEKSKSAGEWRGGGESQPSAGGPPYMSLVLLKVSSCQGGVFPYHCCSFGVRPNQRPTITVQGMQQLQLSPPNLVINPTANEEKGLEASKPAPNPAVTQILNALTTHRTLPARDQNAMRHPEGRRKEPPRKGESLQEQGRSQDKQPTREWWDFCNSLLSGCPNNSLRSLQLIKNAAARVLTGIDKRDHITPAMASLHWLPVKFRIIFKTLLLIYKVLRGLAPSYLEELVTPYQRNGPLRSQNAGLLVVPRVSRGRMGGRAFSYQAPLLWNQLPV
ncbi:hypothetical protein D4764_16G0004600 [Takifugu flavidus]|uniref:Uncharacterized protein n=1 Tax=Takifugu flavidus TaxID=433684 RepID=A0A5C6NXC5_9TELE|nr:hypothetical protein D4764_16G0004600 [Takifugu flavidus]